ncbi:amino acid adenylation domain-containing protein [Micromonospora sp. NPDC050980]|uniref:non-ribosomal peptide synthetase n=1 Tax=Micromonospora sp. NPDC050980 TaxID=3155161 RepID=UPI0034118236
MTTVIPPATREVAHRYWLSRLAAFPGAARFGVDHRRSAPDPDRWGRMEFALTGERYEGLVGIAGDDPLDIHAAVAAALCVCLYRYTGLTPVTIGSAPLRRDGDRTGGGGDPLTVLLEVHGRRALRELVRDARIALDEAYRHQDYRMSPLLDDLGLSPQDAGCPLFDVLLTQSGTHAPVSGSGAALVVSLSRQPNGVAVTLEHDREVLTPDEARWIRDHLLSIIDAGRADPDATVAAAGQLPAELVRQLLKEWNGPIDPEVRDACLHHLVEEQVRERGDAVAVRATRNLGYAELNRRANRLAHHLIACVGVRPGDIVAVAMTRSVDLVTCLLAVLKTGAAYLPLDPAYPADRLSFMLADSAAEVLLTDGCADGKLPEAGLTVIGFDAGEPELSTHPADDPVVVVTPESAASIIYTSGTTGSPKGVVMTHRGLANSIRWERSTYQFDASDRLLHMASPSFSLAIVEIFAPLCAGAEVVLAPEGVAVDGPEIAGLVTDLGVTVLSVVPAELAFLLDEPAMPWTRLKCVVTGADILPAPLLERYLATCPSVPLFNVYGTTETSVDGIFWTCRAVPDHDTVPIGRPVTNTTAYVLDGDYQLAAVGVPGELFLGGAGLTRGYLNRPGLTAERFVPDPFSRHPGARLYRTGDIARWMPSGFLELRGRNDHQVQIHGVRVELEEVEAVLCRHPDVRHAAVAVQRLASVAVPGDQDWTALFDAVEPATAERLLAEVEALADG